MTFYTDSKALAKGRFKRIWGTCQGDLSAPSGANAIGRDEKFAREFVIRRADQLLFGSDFLEPQMDVPQFELFDKLNLPAEVQAKIFRDNATRVLGLDTAR